MIERFITSSLLILIILALRAIFKGRISLRLQYAAWLLVAIRLLMPPLNISSGLSVMNSLDTSAVENVVSTEISLRPTQQFQTVEEYKNAYASDNGISVSEVQSQAIMICKPMLTKCPRRLFR